MDEYTNYLWMDFINNENLEQAYLDFIWVEHYNYSCVKHFWNIP